VILQGELTHEQLGERYVRAPQSIANFSSRNADEVRRARQVQSDEYQGLGYAAKWERLALREHSVTYGDDSEQEDWGFA